MSYRSRLNTMLYTIGVFAFGVAMGVELMTRKVLDVMDWETYNTMLQPQAATLANYYETLMMELLVLVVVSLSWWVYRIHWGETA